MLQLTPLPPSKRVVTTGATRDRGRQGGGTAKHDRPRARASTGGRASVAAPRLIICTSFVNLAGVVGLVRNRAHRQRCGCAILNTRPGVVPSLYLLVARQERAGFAMCRLNACRHLKHLEANAQVRLAHKTMPPHHWAVDLGIPWHIQPWSPQYDRGGYHLRLKTVLCLLWHSTFGHMSC